MVFISRGRSRGANRGRGRGVGEVAFEPRAPSGPPVGRDERQPAESLRITVGNDQFRDHPPVGGRHDPPRDAYNYDDRHEEDIYRREAEAYARADRASYERERDYDRRDLREPPQRPEERDYGDRRGLGGGGSYEHQYEPPSAAYPSRPSQPPLFPAAGTHSPPRIPAQVPQSSRPLKSILKKKPDPVQEQKPASKPSGLPGIASYMDDIEDEDKFLYGEDNRDRRQSAHDVRPGGQFQAHSQVDDIRSAAQSWQPSAPVSSSVPTSQHNYNDNSTMQQQQQYHGNTDYHNQPAQAPAEGGDLWSMLAKSVQTVQQAQQQQQQQQQQFPAQGQFDSRQENLQPQFSAQSAPLAIPAQPTQGAQAPGHDPTIENILKSIGFDFEMSKRMQEKAKQGTEPPKAVMKPSDSQFGINHTASFIGSEMSHEDMRSHLAPGLEPNSSERVPERIHDESRGSQDMFEFDDRGRSSRERVKSPKKGRTPERLQRGCSPISADGSPPPPMFNLPPITIKRRSNVERNISPNWDRKRSLSRSPTRDSNKDRTRHRSRSPSWNRSISSYGRRSSRSPARRRSPSPGKRSPDRVKSPVIKRTFNLDALSPIFRRRVSPRRSVSPGRKRSRSPRRRSRSPGRRSRSPVRRIISPGRRRSPGIRSRSPARRRSRSPVRRISPGRRRSRSRSPNRRRSRSPRRRRNSPNSRGRDRSNSPRGRKRMSSRSRSRERKIRRSSSRDRFRKRSRSRSRSRGSHSPRPRRSVSLSSDSDPDGPANKTYFSAPLRLSRNMPPGYHGPPPVSYPGPPPANINVPPPSGFGPPGPPPGFPMQGMPPPPGQPPFGMPPMQLSQPPPIGVPPPGFQYVAPTPVMYTAAPPAPMPVSAPFEQEMAPPGTAFEQEMAPPGTMEMPLNLPSRSNPSEVTDERKERDGESPSSKSDRSDQSGRRESSSSRKVERSSSSSNRTVLPPRSKSKDEESTKKSSSNERVVVIGKHKKEGKDHKKVDVDKERAKLVKEKEIMVNKIRVLEIEFNNLKQQEFDLKKRPTKDGKVDPILSENKKLGDAIKKEINKIVKQKEEFERKHEFLKDSAREVKMTPKKPVSEKGKSDKKEEFKVEKGKMMRHYFWDKGDHWCKPCNTVHTNIQDFLHHLACYKHKQTLPSDFRPWMDGFQANDGMILNKQGSRIALPGVEFMMPVSAYYCQLCKVFLGDVSFAVDHFKCESHYINYKKYLSKNQFYEKKWKEERDKAVKLSKNERQKEAHIQKAEAKEVRKRTDSEKDARIRENEKKWDKSVDDLDDINERSSKKGAGKSQSQIKLSLKGQSSKTESSDTAKDSENSVNSKESVKSDDKTDNKSESEKCKINFNISLGGKALAGKAIVGKTGPGAAKKNPLLPPWQPVGKKSDVKKPLEAASLDQFLTTNSGDGKIPVVTEKKKISAKDVLASFSNRCKDREEAAKNQAKAEEEKIAAEIAAEKAKQDFMEEIEKRMLAIESETALAEKIPPPPVSQNVPLPDQKPSATVTSDTVHTVYNSEHKAESSNAKHEENPNDNNEEMVDTNEESSVTETELKGPKVEVTQITEIDLSDIPIPAPKPEKISIEPEPVQTTEKMELESFKTNGDIVSELPQAPVETEVKGEQASVQTNEEIVSELPDTSAKTEVKGEPASMQTNDDIVSELPDTSVETEVKGEPTPMHTNENIISEIPDAPIETEVMKREPALGMLDENDPDKSDELVNLEMLEAATNQFNTIFDSDLSNDEDLAPVEAFELKDITKDELDAFDLNIEAEMKLIPDNISVANIVKDADVDGSDISDSKPEIMLENTSLQQDNKQKDKTVSSDQINVPEANEDDAITEPGITKEEEKDEQEETVEELVEVEPKTRGRGRGRGRGSRGRGRGSKAKAAKTTKAARQPSRSLRSSKVTEVAVEISEPETAKTIVTDNVETDPSNKDLELSSSVEIGNTSKTRAKKSSSKVRKSSMKLDSAKVGSEQSADVDDAASDASGCSMEMGSEFEVVDDLEDMDVLDEVA